MTKDDEAKRDHLPDIIRHQISVVWIRGVDRRKNRISPKELHLMLTVRLGRLVEMLGKARGPQHYLLYLNGERPTLEGPLDIHTLRRKQRRSQRTN